MKSNTFYIADGSPALRFAAEYLKSKGNPVVFEPDDCVTHAVLPVPSFDDSGSLEALLRKLPQDVMIFGGKLDAGKFDGYRTADLLRDESYLAENAAITADCAVRLAGRHLGVVLRNCPILIIGWGRIGKCLAEILKSAGAEVTVAARKETDRAMARALGFEATDIRQLWLQLARFLVIFNTAPATVLAEAQMNPCRKDCVKIDLASVKGMEGGDVIWARGLPGKDAPESSGVLIGKTVLRLAMKEALQ